MLPWLPPFPVTKTWDESKHPRSDDGRFAHIHGAIASKLGWDAADYQSAAKLSAAGLKQTAATAGVSAADLKAAIAERNAGGTPAAPPAGKDLAALVHAAALSIPDPFGNTAENAHGNHKVYVADLYDLLGAKLGGMSLGEFKAALMAAMQAGHLSLGRSDMLPYTKNPAQGNRSEIVHPHSANATFHVVNVPVKGKAFGFDILRHLSKTWNESEHPRETTSHDGKRPGEFAPGKTGGGAATKEEKVSDEMERAVERCVRRGSLARLPESESEASALAWAAREEVIGGDDATAAPGDCVAATRNLASIHPDIEVWKGMYPGDWEEGGTHYINKVGDYFIDITADQFDGPAVRVFTEDDRTFDNFYSSFGPVKHDPSQSGQKPSVGIIRTLADFDDGDGLLGVGDDKSEDKK